MKENYLKNTKQKKVNQTPRGITLVALVITVIILLILAGVAISLITGQDGLFSRAENAGVKYNQAAQNEKDTLEALIHELNKVASDIKVSGSNITLRSFDINVELHGIDEKITKIEYYMNNELLTTTENTVYSVENLDVDTEYIVYVKAYNEKNQEYISNTATIKTLPIIAKLEATYVGTRQFEATVTIENGDEEISEIEYFVDGTSNVKNAERSNILGEYEPESTHRVYAVLYNEKGKTWKTNEIEVTTEPRTYLYKEGDECVELTGGWQRGAYNHGSFTKYDDYMNLSGNSGGADAARYNTGDTVNLIDFSKYKTIHTEMEYLASAYINGYYYITGVVVLVNPRYTGYGNPATSQQVSPGNSTSKPTLNTKRVYSYPIAISSGYVSLRARLQTTSNQPYSINVYNIWLEK